MLFTMLVWGIAPVFIRSLSVDLGAADALVIRYALVTFGFGIGLYIVGRKSIAREDWPRVLFISLVGLVGYSLGSVFGFELVPASIGGIIIGTQPLLIVLMAALLSRTAPSPAAIAGLTLAFVGTGLLFWNDLLAQSGRGNLALGAIYIFLSGFAWALYVVLAKPLILKYGTYQITALTILLSSIPLLVLVSTSTFATLFTMSLRNWAEMFYMAVIASLVATVTWNYAAARLSSVATGAFLYLVPVIAVIAGALFLDETVTISMVSGGLLILIGVAIAQYADRLMASLPPAPAWLASPQAHAYAALFTAVLLWGLVPVAMRFLVSDLSPETVLFLRLLPTGLLAGAALLIVGMKPLRREDWTRLLVAALIGNCGYQILAHIGIKTVPASWTGMIFGLEPIFIALLAVLVAGERLSAQLITGMAVAFAGVGILTLGGAASAGRQVGLFGLLLVTLSTVGWAIYTVMIRPLAQRYGSFEMSCLTLLISALPMALFARPGLDAEVHSMGPSQWAVLAFLILFGTFLAIVCWNYGVSKIESSVAGMALYIQPLIAALGGILLLGEGLSWPLAVGGLIIITGVAVSQWQLAPPNPVLEPPPPPGSEKLRSAVERLVTSSKEAQRSK
jgi:drug/metabolite transporter (DMT)-like permease